MLPQYATKLKLCLHVTAQSCTAAIASSVRWLAAARSKGEGKKGKVHPRTGREGPEGE